MKYSSGFKSYNAVIPSINLHFDEFYDIFSISTPTKPFNLLTKTHKLGYINR